MIKARDLFCQKIVGGKKPLWCARHNLFWLKEGNGDSVVSDDKHIRKLTREIVGAGNTAENAIKDYQKQFRLRVKSIKPEPVPDCVNVPHKPGECWWCDMTLNVLSKVEKNLSAKVK